MGLLMACLSDRTHLLPHFLKTAGANEKRPGKMSPGRLRQMVLGWAGYLTMVTGAEAWLTTAVATDPRNRRANSLVVLVPMTIWSILFLSA